jgi:DNA-3-methyladenine glycosylase
MTTPGAATPPRFKRSSPRKKLQPRSRRLAVDFAAGEAEAAGASVASRATPLLPATPAVPAQSLGGIPLPREFFELDALDLAPRLLGKLLRRDQVVLRITEVLVLFILCAERCFNWTNTASFLVKLLQYCNSIRFIFF